MIKKGIYKYTNSVIIRMRDANVMLLPENMQIIDKKAIWK